MKKKIYAEISEYQSRIYGDGYDYSLNRKIKDEYQDDEIILILDKYLKRVSEDDTGVEWEGELEEKEIKKLINELDEIFEN